MMSFDQSPRLRVAPPLFSLILLYVTQHRSLTPIGQKKAASHSLIFTRDIRKRDKEKSSVQDSEPPVKYLNNSTHEGNLRSTPGRAEPTAQYFFKNSTTVLNSKRTLAVVDETVVDKKSSLLRGVESSS
jgi:hypothetical protein